MLNFPFAVNLYAFEDHDRCAAHPVLIAHAVHERGLFHVLGWALWILGHGFGCRRLGQAFPVLTLFHAFFHFTNRRRILFNLGAIGLGDFLGNAFKLI